MLIEVNTDMTDASTTAPMNINRKNHYAYVHGVTNKNGATNTTVNSLYIGAIVTRTVIMTVQRLLYVLYLN